MALTDKLTAIANAIRGKTNKTGSLTLSQMVDEINNNWHAYVKEVVQIGSFDKINTSDIGLTVVSYTADGRVLLTSKSYTSSGEYEHIRWVLRSAPEGVGIIVGNKPSSQTNGERGQLVSCILTGINRNCKVSLEQTDTSSSNDYTEISIDIEYLN